MNKRLAIVIAIAAFAMLLCGTVTAAPSFLTTSGCILTPDSTILPVGDFGMNISAISRDGRTENYGGIAAGVFPGAEFGITAFDLGEGESWQIGFNAKLLVMPESGVRPAIVVGVANTSSLLSEEGDISAYALIGLDAQSMMSKWTRRPSVPVRAAVGIGTGQLEGLFASLTWTMNDRFQLMGEFLSNDAMFNFGARVTLVPSLRADLALIDGDFGYGLTYTKSLY